MRERKVDGAGGYYIMELGDLDLHVADTAASSHSRSSGWVHCWV